MGIEVIRLGDVMLAEVKGVDITKPIEPEEWFAVYQAFLDHGVLVFRDQPLTPGLMVQFATHFGELQPHITKKCWHPEFNELIVMTNLDENGELNPKDDSRGDTWHTDMCYFEEPAKATMLHTQQIPDVGGDTQFGNMTKAFDEMPATLKNRIENKIATEVNRQCPTPQFAPTPRPVNARSLSIQPMRFPLKVWKMMKLGS